MGKIQCQCTKHLPKAKRKYLGFVAKCNSCGDLWFCQEWQGTLEWHITWQPLGKSSIERLLNG